MRAATTPLTYELSTTGGSKSVAVTPGAVATGGTFLISGIDPFIQDMRNYMTRFWVHNSLTFNPDATGAVVNWDKLYKGTSSVELTSQLMGVVYPHKHTSGVVLGHIYQVLALGYRYPQGARTQIPVDTATDLTLDLFYALPLAHECLVDPMETAQWTGFFDGGTIEVLVAPSTVYDGDYAGSTIDAATLRVQAETMPSPREYIGVPFQYRNRQIAGGGSSPILRNVGGETSLNGVKAGCGLAALLWLTDATGIGLGGPDGVDNILSLAMQWRGQKNTQNLDPYFHYLKVCQEKRVGPISGVGTSPVADGAGWPFTMAATPNNRPSKDSQSLFLPMIVPGNELMTSKVQRVLGDLMVDFTTAVDVTTAHQFVTWELMEFTDDQVIAMASRGRFAGTASRKQLNGDDAAAKALRYTAIEFSK